MVASDLLPSRGERRPDNHDKAIMIASSHNRIAAGREAVMMSNPVVAEGWYLRQAQGARILLRPGTMLASSSRALVER